MRKEEFDTDFEMGVGMLPKLVYEEEIGLQKEGPFGNPMKAHATFTYDKVKEEGRVAVEVEEEGFGVHNGSAKEFKGAMIDKEIFNLVVNDLIEVVLRKIEVMNFDEE
jgi:hypothetical protein